MKRRILAAALLATLCGSPLGAQTSNEPTFGEVVEVTIVNVDVYVTDKDGNRVTGLKKEDFSNPVHRDSEAGAGRAVGGGGRAGPGLRLHLVPQPQREGRPRPDFKRPLG
jgi:hypothetical protein